MKSKLTGKLIRVLIISIVGLYLLIPILAMADFSTKPYGGGNQGRSLRAWRVIPSTRNLVDSITLSISLAAIVILLIFTIIVPTIVWVQLRLPKLRKPLELICLIPLAIPAIVIVVGIAPIYRFISIHITESPLSLAAVYSMLVLPYVHRSLSSALDTSDISTLYEAAKTLGANNLRIISGVIMPTIRAGIINGAVIAIALVLGEFTISSLLNYETLQVVVFRLGRSDGNVAVAVSVASLIFVFTLLLLIPSASKTKEVLDVDVA